MKVSIDTVKMARSIQYVENMASFQKTLSASTLPKFSKAFSTFTTKVSSIATSRAPTFSPRRTGQSSLPTLASRPARLLVDRTRRRKLLALLTGWPLRSSSCPAPAPPQISGVLDVPLSSFSRASRHITTWLPCRRYLPLSTMTTLHCPKASQLYVSAIPNVYLNKDGHKTGTDTNMPN